MSESSLETNSKAPRAAEMPDSERLLMDQDFWSPDSGLDRMQRLTAILKWYPKKQIFLRVKKLIGEKWRKGIYRVPPKVEASADHQVIDRLRILVECRRHQWLRQWSSGQFDDFGQGKVTLLNQQVNLGTEFVDKSRVLSEVSHLWRFQWHYHEFLLRHWVHAEGLDSEQKRKQTHSQVIHFVQDSLEEFDTAKNAPKGDRWHPYCISRRVPVWCQLLSRLEISSQESSAILSSIFQQARCLENHLEWDLGGNHLLENLRALGYVYALFHKQKAIDGKSTWLFKLLQEQADKQILATGEHFERSPMYHCQVTWIFLELALLFDGLGEVEQKISAFCQSTARSQLEFLASICHPDGEIPLFADSCFEEAPDVKSLRNLAQALGLTTGSADGDIVSRNNPSKENTNKGMLQGDYWVYQSQGGKMIVDCGPVAAPELPAHGHCDLGNFELSLDGQRVVTDTGIVNYSGSPEHRFCKSSVAHNVVTIAGRNCCEIWDKFRMGFRGKIEGICCSTFPELPESSYISFRHDGYRKSGCSEFTRCIGQLDSDCLFCFDYAKGLTSNDYNQRRIGFLHFHPTIKLECISPSVWHFQTSHRSWLVRFFGTDGEDHLRGHYCAEFGRFEDRSTLCYVQSGQSRPVGWVIQPEARSAIQVESDTERTSLQMDLKKVVHTWG